MITKVNDTEQTRHAPGTDGFYQSWEDRFQRLEQFLSDQVAEQVRWQGLRRLEFIALTTVALQVLLFFVVNLLLGTFGEAFATPVEWMVPSAVAATSIGMVWLIRSRRVEPATLARLGLGYQVVISVGIAVRTYYGAFVGVDAEAIRFGRDGVTMVAVWMLLFSVLVPARPREALVALIASASTIPLTVLAQMQAGLAPALPAGKFVLVFVVPYAITVGLSYLATRIVHGLGVEIRRAHELGSYRLETLLGRGGMGEVWRASHRTLARPAAIKLIRSETLGGDRALASARFEREAQAIASLQSLNTIALYDFGSTDDGTLFYVMELLDGVDLEELVRKHGPLPAERVAHIIRQACASLHEAHARGIIHRDIKPANIYLCRYALEHDVVKVLDFGLVKHSSGEGGKGQAMLTNPELLAGTPAYLAPEIILGRTVDRRVDLYALGCVAYWLLTGHLVFEANTIPAMLVAHAHETPKAPSSLAESPVPEALDRIVLDCLAKDPDARPASAGALADRLGEVPFAKPWMPAEASRWWEGHRPTSPDRQV